MPTLTWDSAAEWDNAVSESNVVHESVSGTDYSDASVLRRGYKFASPTPSASLLAYYPFQEASGTTANDISGNNNDATYNGPTLDGADFLSADVAVWTRSDDDYVSVPALFSSATAVTWIGWARCDTDGVEQRAFAFDEDNEPNGYLAFHDGGTTDRLAAFVPHDGSAGNEVVYTGGDLSTWTQFAVTAVENSTIRLYVNGTERDSITSNVGAWSNIGVSSNNHIGASRVTTDLNFDGPITEFRVYAAELSSAEVQSHYDVVTTAASLITATKGS